MIIKTYYKNEHPKFPDGGWLSQHMDTMRIGDELDFRGPTGAIIYEGDRSGTYDPGGWYVGVSANFGRLVLGCIEATFYK